MATGALVMRSACVPGLITCRGPGMLQALQPCFSHGTRRTGSKGGETIQILEAMRDLAPEPAVGQFLHAGTRALQKLDELFHPVAIECE